MRMCKSLAKNIHIWFTLTKENQWCNSLCQITVLNSDVVVVVVITTTTIITHKCKYTLNCLQVIVNLIQVANMAKWLQKLHTVTFIIIWSSYCSVSSHLWSLHQFFIVHSSFHHSVTIMSSSFVFSLPALNKLLIFYSTKTGFCLDFAASCNAENVVAMRHMQVIPIYLMW